ncbi:hypothetical protein BACCOPRO_00486 [Phocaeicola coprophilus DSM 18228 = JCM 13818]|uniref:Uncharacterized protein n=1 Tax=Phocaeicola coprophilus DSM 18228 = JCM 13818 TaxID=547042 RepID=S0F4M5_9BACT|nr:hypothetical protein BACCOPRO_00486 [Phocaeicola coprophilus DSM 18228 = JCM 13818]
MSYGNPESPRAFKKTFRRLHQKPEFFFLKRRNVFERDGNGKKREAAGEISGLSDCRGRDKLLCPFHLRIFTSAKMKT